MIIDYEICLKIVVPHFKKNTAYDVLAAMAPHLLSHITWTSIISLILKLVTLNLCSCTDL